jgi:ribosome-associated translation inhibitor RaiA
VGRIEGKMDLFWIKGKNFFNKIEDAFDEMEKQIKKMEKVYL